MSPDTPLDLSATWKVRHDNVVDDGIVRSFLPFLSCLRYVTRVSQKADTLYNVPELRIRIHGFNDTIYVPQR